MSITLKNSEGVQCIGEENCIQKLYRVIYERETSFFYQFNNEPLATLRIVWFGKWIQFISCCMDSGAVLKVIYLFIYYYDLYTAPCATA